MSYTLNLIKDGDTVRTARAADPYEFQYLIWNDEEGSGTLYTQFTDNPNEAMAWAGQLKFDEEIMCWDWIVHYADGSREFVMRSLWVEDGGVPEDTTCR